LTHNHPASSFETAIAACRGIRLRECRVAVRHVLWQERERPAAFLSCVAPIVWVGGDWWCFFSYIARSFYPFSVP
jgi:hypothetical protein